MEMIRLDTKTEFISMQFTGARPKTLESWKRSLAVSPQTCSQSPVLGKQEVSAVKEGSAWDGDLA